MKQNFAGRWQVKNLLLTTQNLIHLDEDIEVKRITPITDIAAITLKKDDDLTDKYDFIVHIMNGDDYMFYSKNRDEIITCLRSAYFLLTEANLPVFEMSSKLHIYRSKKGAQTRIPSEQFRSTKVPSY